MENAFGQPQSVVVLGGTSDIADALVGELVAARARTVILAGRNPETLAAAAERAATAGATTTATVVFDAADPSNAEATVRACFDAAQTPVDLVVVAVGYLGDQLADEVDPLAAAHVATVNYTWPVAALAALTTRMLQQGTGRILVITSVAGIRVRRGSYLYGSAKAGLDRHCEGMADALLGTGVTVQILRPGFVHTKMTEGMKAAPFAVDAQRVARDTVAGLASSSRVIYSPSIMKWLFGLLRHLPAGLWRALNESR